MFAVNGYYHDGRVDLFDEATMFTDDGVQVSANSLAMMDEAIENFRSGLVSDALNLSEFMKSANVVSSRSQTVILSRQWNK